MNHRHWLKSLTIFFSSCNLWAQTPDTTPPVWTLHGNVTAATDYHWRGISMSNGQPALHAGLQVIHRSGIYAGLLATSISLPNNNASLEAIYTIGYQYQIHPQHRLNFQYIDINYPGAAHSQHYDFEEYSIGLISQSLLRDQDQWSSSISFSPDAYGQNGNYWRLDSRYNYPLNEKFGVFAAIGASKVEDNAAFQRLWGNPNKDHYYDWKIGLSANRFGLNGELYYARNSGINPASAAFDPRFVLAVTKPF